MKHIQNAVLAGILIPAFGVMPAFNAHIPAAEQSSLDIEERLITTQASTLLPVSSPMGPERVAKTMRVFITAYSSTPEQTDDTPFITASGKHVRDGIVATNLLPLGTKIKIPEIYGNRIFVVEDRMNARNNQHVDIWFPTYWEAKYFGIKRASVVVLEG